MLEAYLIVPFPQHVSPPELLSVEGISYSLFQLCRGCWKPFTKLVDFKYPNRLFSVVEADLKEIVDIEIETQYEMMHYYLSVARSSWCRAPTWTGSSDFGRAPYTGSVSRPYTYLWALFWRASIYGTSPLARTWLKFEVSDFKSGGSIDVPELCDMF